MTLLPQSSEAPFGPDHTPYESLGGDEAVRRLVDRFYDHMDADEDARTIRGLHQPDLATARRKLYEFLSGWLGGPSLYIEKYGHPRPRGRHMPFAIGEMERDQWLACISRSLDDESVSGDLRAFLDARFAHVANFIRNQGASDGATE